MNQYYNKKIYIPQVDRDGNIKGKVERWEAHKKGILHKGFSVLVQRRGNIIFQVRKHPVFDTVLDVTCSSHPIMYKIGMEDEYQAVVRCIKREWNKSISEKKIQRLGSVYYKAKDPLSIYSEHEICTFYTAHITDMIFPNKEYAYGFMSISRFYLKKQKTRLPLAPWVCTMIEKKII